MFHVCQMKAFHVDYSGLWLNERQAFVSPLSSYAVKNGTIFPFVIAQEAIFSVRKLWPSINYPKVFRHQFVRPSFLISDKLRVDLRSLFRCLRQHFHLARSSCGVLNKASSWRQTKPAQSIAGSGRPLTQLLVRSELYVLVHVTYGSTLPTEGKLISITPHTTNHILCTKNCPAASSEANQWKYLPAGRADIDECRFH